MNNINLGDLVETDPQMDLYIARHAPWKWHDGDLIDIVDTKGEMLRTLDKWQTWIFHEADGGRTVRNLLAWIASHYREHQSKPLDLDRVVLKALSELVEDMGVVKLCKEGPVLSDELLTPWTGQRKQ
jgi:hypothetical protein